MQKKSRKQFIEYSLLGALALTLYLTGWHTEVIGFLQRGVLATGLMDPDMDKLKEGSISGTPVKANFNFTLVDSEEEKVTLQEFEGKTIFMNLWATWCPPCIAEMPGIDKLYNELRDGNVEFVMLSQDEDFEKAKEFIARKGFDFEIYRVLDFLPAQYRKGSIPTTFIINPKGHIVLTHKGMADYGSDDFKEYLKGLN